jgi:hypothetical protein
MYFENLPSILRIYWTPLFCFISGKSPDWISSAEHSMLICCLRFSWQWLWRPLRCDIIYSGRYLLIFWKTEILVNMSICQITCGHTTRDGNRYSVLRFLVCSLAPPGIFRDLFLKHALTVNSHILSEFLFILVL